MRTITVTEARTKLFRLIDKVAMEHEPMLLTGKRNKAVLVSEADWREIEETLALLSVPGLKKDLMEGVRTPVEDCVAESDLDW